MRCPVSTAPCRCLRRMLRLAVEWGKSEKAAPRVLLLPGERRRERVLSPAEEAAYLKATQQIGDGILAAYERALEGIRATARDEQPIKPDDPFLLRDVATVLLDCGLRPEECYRLRWEHVRDNAAPYSLREDGERAAVNPLAESRGGPARHAANRPRLPNGFSGTYQERPHGTIHPGNGTPRRVSLPGIEALPFYTFRHTCLTRWASHMDPYTLAYFAGHSDFGTTRRYVHPNMDTGRAAMERAREVQGGHKSGHNAENTVAEGESNRRP